MKKTIILLLLLVITSNIFSQNLNLSDLIKMIKMDVETFDTYITQKGFSFESNMSDELAEGRIYKHSNVKIKGDKFVSKYQYVNKDYTDPYKNHIQLQTIYKDEYVGIKSDLLKYGFKFSYTKKMDENIFNGKDGFESVYLRNRIKVNLISYINRSESERTIYEITIKEK